MYLFRRFHLITLIAGTLAQSSENTGSGYEIKSPPLDTPWTWTLGTNPWTEHPRPQLARSQWLSLNGIWQWERAEFESESDTPPFGRALEQSIMVPSCVESALSGVMEAEATHSFFRTLFERPSNWDSDRRVLLNFGAIDYISNVYVNERKVARHVGGYWEFTTDITDYLVDGPNELMVFVIDETDDGERVVPTGKQARKPGHIWYTPCSGIWQSVWIESVPPVHITGLHIDADMHGVLNVTVERSSIGHGVQETPVSITVWERTENSSATEPSGAVGIYECSTIVYPCTFSMVEHFPQTLKLWSPDSPTLYNIAVQLNPAHTKISDDAPGSASDTVYSYVGFRSISRGQINGVQRPLLNGAFLFLFGALDQGYWPDGIYTPPNREAMESDLRYLKRLGFNMVRKHVKIEPALFYTACDTLGLLVMQDMPNLSNTQGKPGRADQAEFARQTGLMVRQLRNHPSIAAWVLYNEGWGQVTTEHPEFELVERVRVLDPSGRLVNANSGWHDHGAGDFSDNHHYASPQCGTPWSSGPGGAYDVRRIALQGEFGGGGHEVPLEHLWNQPDALATINGTYELSQSLAAWNLRAHQLLAELRTQVELFACSAAVCTQTTDVEGEVNGLLSYDRRIARPDEEQWRADIAALYAAARKRAEDGAENPSSFVSVDADGVGLGQGWWGGASLEWVGEGSDLQGCEET